MEPRSCDRGKIDLGPHQRSRGLLQWSRDHVIAESKAENQKIFFRQGFNGAAIM